MNRSLPLVAGLALAATAVFAQGPVETAPRGAYVCELPGDAAGQVGVAQADKGFVILTSSRYRAPQGEGNYLKRGNRLEMTSGPRKGEVYVVIHPGFLRLAGHDGAPGRLRCVLQGS